MSINPFNSTPFSLFINQIPHKIFLSYKLNMTRVQNEHQFLSSNFDPNNIKNNPKTENPNRNLPIGKMPLPFEASPINNFVHFTQNQKIQQNHRNIRNQLKFKRDEILTIFSSIKIVNLSWVIFDCSIEDFHKFINFYNEFKTGERFVQNCSFGSSGKTSGSH